ncbi:hypothetical protein [Absidia glauca]|uniref:Uncharacterized protein n=1 Tax=Absidia glauca TaxID=4829 RepID=A0A168PTS6_ABSGL|nr:hypothetical protein [Absidia glauca]
MLYCEQCTRNPKESSARKRRRFAAAKGLELHLRLYHQQAESWDDGTPFVAAHVRRRTTVDSTDASTSSNIAEETVALADQDDNDDVLMEENPVEAADAYDVPDYDMPNEAIDTSADGEQFDTDAYGNTFYAGLNNSFEVHPSDHRIRHCPLCTSASIDVNMISDGEQQGNPPATIKELRRGLRNEGHVVLQEFTSTPINLASIDNFPMNCIADFEKAVGPMVFLHRNIKELAEHILLSPSTATRHDEVVYDDLHTSQWWSKVQHDIGDDGAVVIPLMLSSDATLVSTNARHKAWPIYLTLGNVPKSIRYKKEYLACRVLGYLPVINVAPAFARKPWMSLCKAAIFQHCMKILMAPFATAATTMFFRGPKNNIYRCVPMLATDSADLPEQTLLAGTRSWMNGYGCPRCFIKCVDFKKGFDVVADKRNKENMAGSTTIPPLGSFGLKNAFWDTPFDIYGSLVVDDLHQLGGVYSHLLRYIEDRIKKQRNAVLLVQERCMKLPYYTGMKRFDNGFLLSSLTNPTFHELRKHMQLVLCLVYDLIPLQSVLCLRSFVDFFIQINSKEHTEATLTAADDHLRLFFKYLPCFQDLSSMKIPKLHMLTKYTNDIRLKGPLDGYTTMNSERLHQSNAKKPSQRTNYRDVVSFTQQLAKYIEDRDVCLDLYANPPSTLAANVPTQATHAMKTLLKAPWCERIDTLEQHDSRLRGLKTHVTLYLDSLTRQGRGNVSLSNCTQLGSLNIKVYQHMEFTEANDDGSTNITTIRTGKFHNKIYNDHVKAVDVTKSRAPSGQFKSFYGKVLCFFEVVHSNMKKLPPRPAPPRPRCVDNDKFGLCVYIGSLGSALLVVAWALRC